VATSAFRVRFSRCHLVVHGSRGRREVGVCSRTSTAIVVVWESDTPAKLSAEVRQQPSHPADVSRNHCPSVTWNPSRFKSLSTSIPDTMASVTIKSTSDAALAEGVLAWLSAMGYRPQVRALSPLLLCCTCSFRVNRVALHVLVCQLLSCCKSGSINFRGCSSG
jgi:hypothetical protein